MWLSPDLQRRKAQARRETLSPSRAALLSPGGDVDRAPLFWRSEEPARVGFLDTRELLRSPPGAAQYSSSCPLDDAGYIGLLRDRRPLDLESAGEWARDKTKPAHEREEAARYLKRSRRGAAYRDALAIGLKACSVREMEADFRGRRAIKAIEVEGAGICRVSGRFIRPDWTADPATTASHLDACCRSSVFQASKVESGLKIHEIGMGCDDPLCPVCLNRRAARRAKRDVGTIAALAEAGHAVVLLTLTLPHDLEARGKIVLSDADIQRGFVALDAEVAGPGEEGVSSLGPDLGWLWEELTNALRKLTNGTKSRRRFWKETVVSVRWGLEATSFVYRTINGKKCKIPRWHPHAHAAIVLSKEASASLKLKQDSRGDYLDGPWVRRLKQAWAQVVPGIEPYAQRITPVLTGFELEHYGNMEPSARAHAIQHALMETLKYPVKTKGLTRAQSAEWIAVTKGLRFDRGGGWTSHRSATGQEIVGLTGVYLEHGPESAEAAATVAYLKSRPGFSDEQVEVIQVVAFARYLEQLAEEERRNGRFWVFREKSAPDLADTVPDGPWIAEPGALSPIQEEALEDDCQLAPPVWSPGEVGALQAEAGERIAEAEETATIRKLPDLEGEGLQPLTLHYLVFQAVDGVERLDLALVPLEAGGEGLQWISEDPEILLQKGSEWEPKESFEYSPHRRKGEVEAVKRRRRTSVQAGHRKMLTGEAPESAGGVCKPGVKSPIPMEGSE